MQNKRFEDYFCEEKKQKDPNKSHIYIHKFFIY